MNINNVAQGGITPITLQLGTDKAVDSSLPEITPSTELLLSDGMDSISKILDSLVSIVDKESGLLRQLPAPLADLVVTAFSETTNSDAFAEGGFTRVIKGQKSLLLKLRELAQVVDATRTSSTNIPGQNLLQERTAIVRMLGQHSSRELQRASVILEQITQLVENAFKQTSTSGFAQNTNILAFPFFIGPKSEIPAYLHIYRDDPEDEPAGAEQCGIWLKLSALTDGLGEISALFHLYRGNRLDVRIQIAEPDGVEPFHEALEEIRTNISGSSLIPGVFTVAAK